MDDFREENARRYADDIEEGVETAVAVDPFMDPLGSFLALLIMPTVADENADLLLHVVVQGRWLAGLRP